MPNLVKSFVPSIIGEKLQQKYKKGGDVKNVGEFNSVVSDSNLFKSIESDIE